MDSINLGEITNHAYLVHFWSRMLFLNQIPKKELYSKSFKLSLD